MALRDAPFFPAAPAVKKGGKGVAAASTPAEAHPLSSSDAPNWLRLRSLPSVPVLPPSSGLAGNEQNLSSLDTATSVLEACYASGLCHAWSLTARRTGGGKKAYSLSELALFSPFENAVLTPQKSLPRPRSFHLIAAASRSAVTDRLVNSVLQKRRARRQTGASSVQGGGREEEQQFGDQFRELRPLAAVLFHAAPVPASPASGVADASEELTQEERLRRTFLSADACDVLIFSLTANEGVRLLRFDEVVTGLHSTSHLLLVSTASACYGFSNHSLEMVFRVACGPQPFGDGYSCFALSEGPNLSPKLAATGSKQSKENKARRGEDDGDGDDEAVPPCVLAFPPPASMLPELRLRAAAIASGVLNTNDGADVSSGAVLEDAGDASDEDGDAGEDNGAQEEDEVVASRDGENKPGTELTTKGKAEDAHRGEGGRKETPADENSISSPETGGVATDAAHASTSASLSSSSSAARLASTSYSVAREASVLLNRIREAAIDWSAGAGGASSASSSSSSSASSLSSSSSLLSSLISGGGWSGAEDKDKDAAGGQTGFVPEGVALELEKEEGGGGDSTISGAAKAEVGTGAAPSAAPSVPSAEAAISATGTLALTDVWQLITDFTLWRASYQSQKGKSQQRDKDEEGQGPEEKASTPKVFFSEAGNTTGSAPLPQFVPTAALIEIGDPGRSVACVSLQYLLPFAAASSESHGAAKGEAAASSDHIPPAPVFRLAAVDTLGQRVLVFDVSLKDNKKAASTPQAGGGGAGSSVESSVAVASKPTLALYTGSRCPFSLVTKPSAVCERGLTQARITRLSFSTAALWLAATSENGTSHLWPLLSLNNESLSSSRASGNGSEAGGMQRRPRSSSTATATSSSDSSGAASAPTSSVSSSLSAGSALSTARKSKRPSGPASSNASERALLMAAMLSTSFAAGRIRHLSLLLPGIQQAIARSLAAAGSSASPRTNGNVGVGGATNSTSWVQELLKGNKSPFGPGGVLGWARQQAQESRRQRLLQQGLVLPPSSTEKDSEAAKPGSQGVASPPTFALTLQSLQRDLHLQLVAMAPVSWDGVLLGDSFLAASKAGFLCLTALRAVPLAAEEARGNKDSGKGDAAARDQRRPSGAVTTAGTAAATATAAVVATATATAAASDKPAASAPPSASAPMADAAVAVPLSDWYSVTQDDWNPLELGSNASGHSRSLSGTNTHFSAGAGATGGSDGSPLLMAAIGAPATLFAEASLDDDRQAPEDAKGSGVLPREDKEAPAAPPSQSDDAAAAASAGRPSLLSSATSALLPLASGLLSSVSSIASVVGTGVSSGVAAGAAAVRDPAVWSGIANASSRTKELAGNAMASVMGTLRPVVAGLTNPQNTELVVMTKGIGCWDCRRQAHWPAVMANASLWPEGFISPNDSATLFLALFLHYRASGLARILVSPLDGVFFPPFLSTAGSGFKMPAPLPLLLPLDTRKPAPSRITAGTPKARSPVGVTRVGEVEAVTTRLSPLSPASSHGGSSAVAVPVPGVSTPSPPSAPFALPTTAIEDESGLDSLLPPRLSAGAAATSTNDTVSASLRMAASTVLTTEEKDSKGNASNGEGDDDGGYSRPAPIEEEEEGGVGGSFVEDRNDDAFSDKFVSPVDSQEGNNNKRNLGPIPASRLTHLNQSTMMESPMNSVSAPPPATATSSSSSSSSVTVDIPPALASTATTANAPLPLGPSPSSSSVASGHSKTTMTPSLPLLEPDDDNDSVVASLLWQTATAQKSKKQPGSGNGGLEQQQDALMALSVVLSQAAIEGGNAAATVSPAVVPAVPPTVLPSSPNRTKASAVATSSPLKPSGGKPPLKGTNGAAADSASGRSSRKPSVENESAAIAAPVASVSGVKQKQDTSAWLSPPAAAIKEAGGGGHTHFSSSASEASACNFSVKSDLDDDDDERGTGRRSRSSSVATESAPNANVFALNVSAEAFCPQSPTDGPTASAAGAGAAAEGEGSSTGIHLWSPSTKGNSLAKTSAATTGDKASASGSSASSAVGADSSDGEDWGSGALAGSSKAAPGKKADSSSSSSSSTAAHSAFSSNGGGNNGKKKGKKGKR